MISPFANLPFDYLIAIDDAPGTAGHITEPGYGTTRAPVGPWVMYANCRDQEGNQNFGPYLERTKTDDIGRQYNEWGPDPTGAGFWALIDKQITNARVLGATAIEWDNIDTYDVSTALTVFDRTRAAGLLVAVKNLLNVDGDEPALIRHRSAAVAIIEDGAGSVADNVALINQAQRPDFPLRFVFYGGAEMRDKALAFKAEAAQFPNADIGITFSAGDEYGHSEHILLPRRAATPLPPIGPIVMPDTTVTGADIIAKARSYKGQLHDGPDVPRIAREIAAKYPEMAAYCAGIGEDTPWCGVFNAYIHMQLGIRPAYTKNSTDYDDFAWADAPIEGRWGTQVGQAQAQPGDTVVLRVPHHITFLDSDNGDGTFNGTGGNQGNGVTTARFSWGNVRGIVRPPIAGAVFTPDPFPLIKLGDTGAPVLDLQRRLSITQTGTFDQATYDAVRAYQTAHGLLVDGEVGDETWGALRAGAGPVSTSTALPQDAINRIATLAGASALASYRWNDRGFAPRGYIKGMAVSFAHVYAKWKAGDSATRVMAALPTGDINHDALAWYGVTNITAGASTLRALFSLLIGLGMRESSGDCYMGRDTSASNFDADTVEAGLFQQSWNSHVASAELPKLLAAWRSSNDDGLLSLFREGLSGSPSQNFGTGEGAAFQALCKSKPLFAVYCAGVGLRTIRRHWGPINRREAQMRPEVDALLQQVQAIVDGIVVAPKPIDGEVLPPDKQPQPTLDFLPILGIAINLLRELTMSGAQQPFDFGILADAVENPILQKLLTGGAVTLKELRQLTHEEIALFIKRPQAALPPPAPIPAPEPAPAPVPSPVPVPPAPTTGVLPGLAGGLSISGIIAALMGTGVIGTPAGMGTEPTTVGTLAGILGVISPVIGAAGGWGKALSVGLNLLGWLGKAAGNQAKTT